MKIQALQKSYAAQILAIVFMCSLLAINFAPIITHADTAPVSDTTSADLGTTVSCDSWGTILSASIFTCLFRGAVGLISAGLMYLATWILVLTGSIFDYALKYTVAEFSTLYATFQTFIEKGWQIFRDLANIGIIGIFMFIAISFILGLHEYGQKKMIANVLIIAVLINFSLLFTKIIINSSNAIGTIIYNSSLAAAESATPATGGITNPFSGGRSDVGVAGRFIKAMGLGSFADSFDANTEIGKQQGIWAQMAYGIFFVVLFLGAAIVFAYGAFLLVARAILLLLLMITASAAFATYILPSLAKSEYGWSTWWSSLLKSAVLTPVMMVLLALSIGMAEGIKDNGGSLGNLVGHPTKLQDVQMFLNYMIVLGLLFASFKISSALAGSISGFKFASAAAVSPFTLGSKYLAGPLGRLLGGRLAARMEGSYVKSAKSDRDRAAELRSRASLAHEGSQLHRDLLAQASSYEKSAGKKMQRSGFAGRFADSKFNIMDSKGMKAVMSGIGVKGLAAGESGKDTKGYASVLKERTEAAAKIADKLAPSGKETQDAKDGARRQYKEQRENATAIKNEISRLRDTEKTAARKANQDAQRSLIEGQESLRLARQAGERGESLAEKERIVQAARLAIHDSQVRMQDADSKEYEVTLSDGSSARMTMGAAEGGVTAAKKLTEAAEEVAVSGLKEAAEHSAGEVGRQQGDILTRIVGGITGDNDKVAEAVRKKYHHNRESAHTREIFEHYAHEQEAHGKSGGGSHGGDAHDAADGHGAAHG